MSNNSTSLYSTGQNVSVSANNFTTLYNVNPGNVVVANVPDTNFTTLYTKQSDIKPTQAYGNSNVEAFLNVGTDGSNVVQNINMAGTLTVGGKSELGPVGNVHIDGGSNGYVLTTNGSGNLSWFDPTTGNSNVANYAIHAGTADTALHANISDLANVATIANTAILANTANFALVANTANFALAANIANTANFAVTANTANTALNANHATISNVANSVSGANVSGNVATAVYAYDAGNAVNASFANNATRATSANVADTANSIFGTNVTGYVANATHATIADNANVANSALNVAASSTANVRILGGTAGYVLSTDGVGNLSWIEQTGGNGGGTPGGANTFVQYNKEGAFGGIINFTYNDVTDVLSVGNIQSDAQFLSNIPGANVTGYVPNATHANVSDSANSVSLANVVGIGNIAATNYDGDSQHVLYGNGIWANIPTVSNVANANFANFAGTAFSVDAANIVGIVGNATHANVSDLANSVAGANVTGTVALANHANIADVANSVSGSNVVGDVSGANHANIADVANSVAGANVTGYVANSIHANIADVSNVAYSVSGANVTGIVGNATHANVSDLANSVAGANVTGIVGNATHANISDVANSVSVGNVVGIGNIATINLSGNGSQTLLGNGVWGDATVTLTANYANFAGNVTISAQPNITSVGNLVNLSFNNALAPITANVGQMFWDTGEHTVSLGMENGVTQQIGLENYIYVKASSAITDGQVVMFTGANGDNVLAAPADVTSVGFMSEYVIGVATQSIATNGFGYITTFGKVHGLNTNSFNVGDILWLSTSTPGALTNVQPTDPAFQIQVAAVTKKSAGDGHIQVRVTPYWALNKLTDVTLTTPTTGQALIYNGSNVWINGNPQQANIANVANSVAGANVTGQVANALVAGTVYTNAQPNITSLGTLASLSVTGNITAGNLVANGYISGNGSFITYISGANVNGAVADALTANTANFATRAYSVLNNAQPNITSVGTLVSLNVAGNITSGNVISGSQIVGNGYQLSNINGSNVSGIVANANYAAYAGNVSVASYANSAGTALTANTVLDNAQPNITSVGSLTGLTSGGVVDFTTSSNVSLGPVANVHITGGTSGYVLTTNGSGTLTWAAPVSPAVGPNTAIQYNNNGNFAGANLLTFDANTSNSVLTFGGGGFTNFKIGAGAFIGNTNWGTISKINSNLATLPIINMPMTFTDIGGFKFDGNTTGNLAFANIPAVSLGPVGNVKITGGTSGYVLSTDGTGNLSWITPSSTSPGGTNTYVQFNDSGVFNGVAGFTFNKVTNTLTATNISGNGSGLTSLTGANVTGTVASATTATTATSATTAGTVTTNAQPNITSTGTLTGLTVSNTSGIVDFINTANVSLGSVANLHIDGGTSGYVLSTDGTGGLSWITPPGGNGLPSGVNGSIQFNSSNTFLGSINFIYLEQDVSNLIPSTMLIGDTSTSSQGANIFLQGKNGNSSIVQTAVGGGLTITSTGIGASYVNFVADTIRVGSNANINITGGSNGQVLTTNGSGNLSWTTPSGGSSATDFTPSFLLGGM